MSEQQKNSYPKPKLVPVPSTNIIPERDVDKRPILECRHLGIDFGGLTAVDDFNMAIGRTEIAGLIGPNGAGKTTVFNLLTKVYQPTRGTILLDGVQFPDGVALNLATYGNTGSLDRSAVLAGFLAKARTVGEAEGSHVAVTVNLLSATGLSANRYGEDVGQLLSAAGSGVVEVMPEQFGNGVTSETLTLSSPALDPYKTVSQGLAAAAKALETPAEGEEEEEEERERTLRVPLAAMVQAYTSTTLSQSANKPYGLQEVRDQVRAAEEAGIGAVLYMNPLGDYSALEEQP